MRPLARVAKLVDALSRGSSTERRAGSYLNSLWVHVAGRMPKPWLTGLSAIHGPVRPELHCSADVVKLVDTLS